MASIPSAHHASATSLFKYVCRRNLMNHTPTDKAISSHARSACYRLHVVTTTKVQKYHQQSNNLSDFYQNRLQNIICFLLFEIYRHICQSTKKENDNQLIVAKMVLNKNMAKYKTIPGMESLYPSAFSLHHTGLKLYVIAVFY